ncbi:hypothetical protein T4C_1153 [Trichinella pseudospiralis]|uniref:Uncharacterized protein n=1 Tax=Trichinella pseudospiralis TaxID=6337 RepID=A0A0V1K4U8_TRIPS|nr:hypothetical protein T4C_1153 [Trichinella pseudospiralis]
MYTLCLKRISSVWRNGVEMAECTSTGENQSYRRQSIAITRPLIIIHYRGSSQAQISADEENATKLTIKEY